METPEGLLATIAGWPGARALHASWVAYLLVNAAHILGLALLIGPILTLDARLLGLWRGVPLAVLTPLLTRVAAGGLGLALFTGVWLFTVRPAEYLANPAFLAKLGLIVLALANVGLQHRQLATRDVLAGAEPSAGIRLLAAFSALLWIAVLVAGRWIGFA
ncbi:DUF2214 domain-containing protein [Ancylobacter sp. WKF20]|uniref:DUF6644 family protein n=1 Tax=Ancylobacter sp. WKF20 TaxID=3039801 RepID=UPI002434156B|nr:DUF6644 family protein [Ancylobacter sp. WKF20]WGD30285.1 DUF2214 domain-containing protein [Ancylobacter sp. WKF20]